jgi:hypothetical protein
VVNAGVESREREHPSLAHRALPAEPSSGADGPHDRFFPIRGWRWRVAHRSPRAFGFHGKKKVGMRLT